MLAYVPAFLRAVSREASCDLVGEFKDNGLGFRSENTAASKMPRFSVKMLSASLLAPDPLLRRKRSDSASFRISTVLVKHVFRVQGLHSAFRGASWVDEQFSFFSDVFPGQPGPQALQTVGAQAVHWAGGQLPDPDAGGGHSGGRRGGRQHHYSQVRHAQSRMQVKPRAFPLWDGRATASVLDPVD